MNIDNTDKTIVNVNDLTVDFMVEGEWNRAVDGLSFSVDRGQILAIVGESGSGKSTSAMALIGLMPSNARVGGSVKLHGQELIGADQAVLRSVRGNKIAVIFQEPMTALNPVITIGHQIIEAVRIHFPRYDRKTAERRALELLEMVELPDPKKAFDSFPHQLSGGQRQRAMIAQSISCDPDLLIADEPSTALDVTVQAEILELIRSLKDRLSSGVILITHDMGVVADLADDMIVMKGGIAVERGAVTDIYSNPQHPYSQELLAAVPHLGMGQSSGVIVEKRRDAPVLHSKDLVIEYPKRGRVPAFRAIDGIDLDIYPGEVVGLVGESGSGKTTVGRTIAGLLPAHSGTLTLNGNSLIRAKERELRDYREGLGIVFQDPGSSLNPRWPIWQSIAEPLALSKTFNKSQINARVNELLEQVEIPASYRNRYPHELSGGQRQRIGIARGLALKPSLLIADEPTSALDVSVQAKVLELFMELQQDLGFACLFISHDLAVVDVLADRIAVMHRGKIVEQNTTDEILRNPQDPYTKKLIAAVPVPDPEEQRIRRELRKSQ